MTRGPSFVVTIVICLGVAAVALVVGLVVGAHHASTPRPTADGPSADQPISRPGQLSIGKAVADDSAADATTVIEVTTGRDQTGAVEAFVAYATWAIASPAAAEDPLHVSQALGGRLFPADAAKVDGIDHSSAHDFVPSRGAYRVLGRSGSEEAPDAVMVEVVAPMSIGGSITWRKVGGVISRDGDRWLATSMLPSDVPQPSDPALSVSAMSPAERSRMLRGLGWELFSNTPTDG